MVQMKFTSSTDTCSPRVLGRTFCWAFTTKNELSSARAKPYPSHGELRQRSPPPGRSLFSPRGKECDGRMQYDVLLSHSEEMEDASQTALRPGSGYRCRRIRCSYSWKLRKGMTFLCCKRGLGAVRVGKRLQILSVSAEVGMYTRARKALLLPESACMHSLKLVKKLRRNGLSGAGRRDEELQSAVRIWKEPEYRWNRKGGGDEDDDDALF